MPDYMTIIEPVLEVSLLAYADLDFWQRNLASEGLSPMPINGKAQLMLSTVDAKYMGLRFRELSLSICTGENSYFLAHAYNSIALFALAERRFFQTPYYHGNIQVEKQRIQLSVDKQEIFEARLSSATPCLRTGEESLELKIHLPKRLRKVADKAHYFYAKLEGHTEVYAAQLDSHFLATNSSEQTFNSLQDSGFEPHEWHFRAKAKHSKSKTLLVD